MSWTQTRPQPAAGLTSAAAVGALRQNREGPAAGCALGLLSSAALPVLPLPTTFVLLSAYVLSTSLPDVQTWKVVKLMSTVETRASIHR